MYIIKSKTTKDVKMRVWLKILILYIYIYKKSLCHLVFPSKTTCKLYLLFITNMYKLMGNGRLPT